ncbi:ImuA family protein [Thalassospira mesophila]|uniref:ImuA family protein n=1 Tax=Thalassospira mesophila TaxID=1293891 RepID=UPI000A1F8239|nr:hypothetical protein [Thalassospira mesophila]
MTSKLQQARAALLRAENQWQGRAACVDGGGARLITRAFGNIDLRPHFSAGGLMPTGLHEIMTEHDDSATSALAWYMAGLHTEPSPHAKTPTVLWVRQRKALDQGRLYPPALFASPVHHNLIMMTIDQQQTALWACEEAAKSGQITTIILEATDYDLTAARRLQLACEAGETRLIVLRYHRAGQNIAPSPAWSRWQIKPQETYRKLSLIGGRGVRPASWKVNIDEATLLVSVADTLENRLPPEGYHRPTAARKQSVYA